MKLQIYHGVNAELYIWNGKTGILVDFLHTKSPRGISDMPKRYIAMMEAGKYFFGQTSDVLLTHGHPDHYNEELVKRCMEL